MRKTLLIEIGTEELPPKELFALSNALAQGLQKEFAKHDLYMPIENVKAYATPRRLAVCINDLAVSQKSKVVRRRGPKKTLAYDKDGNPTVAAHGFARSCNTTVADLQVEINDKGSWVFYEETIEGKATIDLIPMVLKEAVSHLPMSKRMRWGNHLFKFVRPVHWLVVLFGKEIVDCEIFGIKACNKTFGHRFHNPKSEILDNADDYLKKLKKIKVIADFNERRSRIKDEINKVVKPCYGRPIINNDLLYEVTALVEYPTAIVGNFDRKFLHLPAEVLTATMQNHQKYFPVVDEAGNLCPHFIIISNIKSRSPEIIKEGNERVINPRLQDAEFFWQRDREKSLSAYRPELNQVIFQDRLGTLWDKSQRVARLAKNIAGDLGYDELLAERAGELCKCDLLTEMVIEFPELQGTMGRYYAIHSGEKAEIAVALDEQYMPRFAAHKLPETNTGKVLAIADKIDTLIGLFAIGHIPTGNKDPFALRRAALGVLRIMIEGNLDLDLQKTLTTACSHYNACILTGETDSKVLTMVSNFMLERLRYYYLNQGVSMDNFEAILSVCPENLNDFHQRLQALLAFRKLSASDNLAVASKRINNILKQGGEQTEFILDNSLLRENAEKKLAMMIGNMSREVDVLMEKNQYEKTLKTLAKLRKSVDLFFDEVMVMCDDQRLRKNRIALLKKLSKLLTRVADISKLQDLKSHVFDHTGT